jgi:hypothetical protein
MRHLYQDLHALLHASLLNIHQGEREEFFKQNCSEI